MATTSPAPTARVPSPAMTRIAIQVGDILGVYIPTNNAGLGLQPLWVIAAATTGYGVFNDGRATSTAFSSTTLQRDELQERLALGLHLYADVCEFSSTIDTTVLLDAVSYTVEPLLKNSPY